MGGINMKIRNKTICILEALFQGHRVKLTMDDLEHEFYWNEDRLCTDFKKILDDNNFAPYPMGFPDITLSEFIKMCEKKTDKEITTINFNNSLTKFNRDRNSKGERLEFNIL